VKERMSVIGLVGIVALVGLGACCSAPEVKAPGPQAVAPARDGEPEERVGALGPLKRPLGPAGITAEMAWEPERLVIAAGYDLIVMTVTRADARVGTTNAEPPRILVTIDEVLGGAVAPGPREVVWAPPPHGVDWVGAGSQDAIAAWGARPLVGPVVGARLIALGKQGNGAYRVVAKLREPLDATLRQVWIDRLAAERAQRDARP